MKRTTNLHLTNSMERCRGLRRNVAGENQTPALPYPSQAVLLLAWFPFILIRSSLTLQALWRHIPDTDFPIVIRLNLHPFFCESQYRGLDRVHVISAGNPFPPCHFIPWLQSFTHRCSFQYSCHL